jgi:hypothetical protein
LSNNLYQCIALSSGKGKLNHGDNVVGKRKSSGAMFLCLVLVTILFVPLLAEVTYSQQTSADRVLSADSDISISYTNSSFTIESESEYGNFSLTFEWVNPGYIIYNGTRRPIKDLTSIAFTDETAGYRMEYMVPTRLYEYVDVDGDNILNDTKTTAKDILIAGYIVFVNIEMTNVTIVEGADGTPTCEWTCTQIVSPPQVVYAPFEIFPTVMEDFHYNPVNGTLKMDVTLNNFTPENASSRVFLSYGVRYVSLKPGNDTVTVAFDGQELPYDQINRVYPISSDLVVFKVNGVERGFFDFGGKVTVDGNPNVHVYGSVGSVTEWYYAQPGSGWLEIGLNYPHVNHTLTHDPYFGLFSSLTVMTFPVLATVATAIISVLICSVAIVDYSKVRNRYLKSAVVS